MREVSASGWEHARNILCVRLDNLGDVLMSTPAMRALRESRSGRRITLLTSSVGAKVAGLIPVVDDVIEYDAPWVKHATATVQSIPTLVESLRKRRFDGAVIFAVHSQSPLPAAMVCAQAGIERRLAHCRENPYQLLTHWVPEVEPERCVRHEVTRQLDLVRHVGSTTPDTRLALEVPRTALASVRDRLAEMGCAGPWVLVHPGSSASSRRYPPELWAEALQSLAAAYPCRVVFAGAAADVGVVESIRARLDACTVSFANELDLPQLAALISCAPVLLCNNSGPAHIAAAVGTPVVDIYALTNPQHTPWRVAQRVLFCDVPCRFCMRSECPQGHHACLRGIDPRAVARAAAELLADSSPTPDASTPTLIDLLGDQRTQEAMH